MPIERHFVESHLEEDSNVYNVICPLDSLPTKEVIESIIVDYVLYLIGKRGFEGLKLLSERRGRTEHYRMLQYIMRSLVVQGKDFEKVFRPRFENRQSLLLTMPERAKLDFVKTLHDIWGDGLANWSRFLGYISFVGAYCINALDLGMVYIITFLVDAAIQDLDSRCGNWILKNGGWRGCYLALEGMKIRYDS